MVAGLQLATGYQRANVSSEQKNDCRDQHSPPATPIRAATTQGGLARGALRVSDSDRGMRIHPGGVSLTLTDLDHGRDIGRRRFGRIHQSEASKDALRSECHFRAYWFKTLNA